MAMDHEPIITNRAKLLREAEGIVNKDRNSVYGNPEDNFKDIASLWSAYKGVSFSSMDVVVMNMLIKVARLKKTPAYRDGLVDIAGYAACGADIQAIMQDQVAVKLGSAGSVTPMTDSELKEFEKRNRNR